MTLSRVIGLRVLTAAITLMSVAVLIYVGVNALPGDAARSALGLEASDAGLLAQKRAELGLDRPFLSRLLDWVDGLLHGDLGTAIPSGTPVWTLIRDSAGHSALLALIALAIVAPLSVVLGVASALKRGKALDHATTASTLTLISTPEFVVASLLATVMAGWLGLFPSLSLLDAQKSVFSQLDLLVLPVLTLTFLAIAQGTRMIRVATIEVLSSSYVQMAILRGVPRRRLLIRHVLPNAVGPAAQVMAFILAYLVGGIVVTETVFAYPGIGVALLSAVQSRDVPTVTAIALILSAVFILANLAADIINTVLNPKLRKGAA